VAGLTVGFGACAAVGSRPDVTPAPPASLGRDALAARHNVQAEKLEQDGWLRQALHQRLIALTIDPDDAAARKGRKRLERLIQREVAKRIREGRAALARGSVVDARRRFLAALALDPANRVAFEALRKEASEVEFVMHTVRSGETLASLGQRYYGDPARAEVIAEANQLQPTAELIAGRALKIPEIPGLPFRPEPRRDQRRKATTRTDRVHHADSERWRRPRRKPLTGSSLTAQLERQILATIARVPRAPKAFAPT
jgi:LysM domain